MSQDKAKEQFIELYNSLSDALFRYCLVRVSNREQARDIVQDTYLRFWDLISRKEGNRKGDHITIEHPRALLYTIAGNLVIDWYRKKKTVSLDALLEPEDDETEFQLGDEGHKNIEIEAEARLLIEKIRTLDSVCQKAVYLRIVEGLEPKEIAQILKLKTNVVSVRINRGIKLLQKMYE